MALRHVSPHSKEVPGSNPQGDFPGQSFHILPMSVWLLSGYLAFLPQSKIMQHCFNPSFLPLKVEAVGSGPKLLWLPLNIDWEHKDNLLLRVKVQF